MDSPSFLTGISISGFPAGDSIRQAPSKTLCHFPSSLRFVSSEKEYFFGRTTKKAASVPTAEPARAPVLDAVAERDSDAEAQELGLNRQVKDMRG
jgi:hypothetical protein